MSYSLGPHRLQSARLLCPWNFPCKNTGVDYHFLLQGIFLTQGLNLYLLHLLHCQAGSSISTTWEALIHLLGIYKSNILYCLFISFYYYFHWNFFLINL